MWFNDSLPGPSVHVGVMQMTVLEFTGYGASGIKTFKFSPDAFVQMALQLAVYKMTGESRQLVVLERDPMPATEWMRARAIAIHAVAPIHTPPPPNAPSFPTTRTIA